MPPLLAYFVTFHTYGTWLHGDTRGSMDDEHNRPGRPFVETNPNRERWEHGQLRTSPFVMGTKEREVVDRTIREVCEFRQWRLHAINVRTNHVHLVVSASADAAKVLHDVKAWPKRRLVETGLVARGACVWARHGSTRYIDTNESMLAAVDYAQRHQ